MSKETTEKKANQTSEGEFYLSVVLSIITDFLTSNPDIIQIKIPSGLEALGMPRTDSPYHLLSEMRRYMPLRRIVIQEETGNRPGISIVIGAAPAGSPHTVWVIPYTVFQHLHKEKLPEYIQTAEQLQYFVDTEVSDDMVKQDYYQFDTKSKQKKTGYPTVLSLPLHSCVWSYIEIDNPDSPQPQIIEYDLFDLVNAKSVEDNPLKQQHLSQKRMSGLYSIVMSEVDGQLDYFAGLYTVYNEYILPQLMMLMMDAYAEGLIVRVPEKDELLISKEEILKKSAVGHDKLRQFATSRGPQSNPTLHFHIQIPTFRRRFVKLVTGREDIVMNAAEHDKFKKLMKKLDALNVTSGYLNHLKTKELDTRTLAKQIDIHGAVYSKILLRKVVQEITPQVQGVLPDKKISVNYFKGQAGLTTTQALRNSGWRITIKDTKADKSLAAIEPLLRNWYEMQADVFKVYLDGIANPNHPVEDALKTIVPPRLVKEITKILTGSQPTEAILNGLIKERPEAGHHLRIKLRKHKLTKQRRKVTNALRQEDIVKEFVQRGIISEQYVCDSLWDNLYFRAETLCIMMLEYEISLLKEQNFTEEELRVKVDEYLQKKSTFALAHQKLSHLTIGVMNKEAIILNDEHSDRSITRNIMEFLVNEQDIESSRSANSLKIPGFIVTWREVSKPDGSTDTVIRLSLCLNERGPVESVYGLAISRAEGKAK